MQAQTVDQVHVLMHLNNIHTDINVLTENGVNGELLCDLPSEAEVKIALELEHIGDCTRVTQLVRHMASGKGVPVLVDINHDGEDDLPHTWSVKQLAWHFAKNAALKDVQDVFVKHKLAGDVIVDMSLDALTPLLSLSLKQQIAFKKEITALRKIIDEGPKDAITHGLLDVVVGGCCWVF